MKRGGISVGNKRGQVTVFIIAGIVIVGLALLIYFLKPGITSTTQFDEKNPNGFIQTCMEKEIEDAVNTLSLQGGSISPESTILYQGEKVEYLCYTTEDCKTCVVQQPMLEQHIEAEIKKRVEGSVSNCFQKLVASYDNLGYKPNLEGGGPDATKVELLPKRIVTSFNYTLTTTKGDTKRYDSFSVVLNNNIYELGSISNSIIDSESETGDASSSFYMSLYPDLKVEKFNQDDGSTVYVLTDRNTQDKFQFASRSLALPGGYACNVATN